MANSVGRHGAIKCNEPQSSQSIGKFIEFWQLPAATNHKTTHLIIKTINIHLKREQRKIYHQRVCHIIGEGNQCQGNITG